MDGIGPGFRGRARTDLSCGAKRAWALVSWVNRKSFAVVVGRPYHTGPITRSLTRVCNECSKQQPHATAYSLVSKE